LNLALVFLIVYSLAVVGLGLWSARFVKTSSAFFVAGRSLGPGLIFSSMLAANIGAGSTIGAAGLAYRDGISAWWWVGSAGLGSFVFAFWVAPKLWSLAREHDFFTTGDFLEHRYNAAVRGLATALVAVGSLVLLAGQLIAGAAIITVVTGAPRWVGSLAGGAMMTIYFTAGGLLGSAWVNTLQMFVMLAGFLFALPFVLGAAGGLEATFAAVPPWFGDITYSSGPGSGWTLLALTGPAFIISPGLIQKAYGGASPSAVRRGVALNAVALLAFAFMPVLLGIVGRALIPGIENRDSVLPLVLTQLLPAWLGALALAAVFSTEVDTCDTILFMLSTSASKDLYKRFINPDASDARLLTVGRLAAVVGGAVGVLLSIWLLTVLDALRIFYSLLVVTMFVPVLGGLYTRRAGPAAALAAIVAGVATLLAVRFLVSNPPAWADPTTLGVVAAAAAFALTASLGTKSIRV
jgi:solute:Na+ symporter, SSS family